MNKAKHHKILLNILLGFTFFIAFYSCENSALSVPKPRMYPRIFFPEKNYTYFDTTLCHFKFKYPAHSKIVQHNNIFEDKPSHPCWFDIKMDSLNATLHCSYLPVNKENNLSLLINDAFKIVDEHNIKANYRRENIIKNGNVSGLQFDIEGPVASAYQFYLTDEDQHFFRAALYLNSKVNPDSTQIIIDFIKVDMDTLISSFSWK